MVMANSAQRLYAAVIRIPFLGGFWPLVFWCASQSHLELLVLSRPFLILYLASTGI